MQFAIIATKKEMEEEKITELSLELRCADEAVSFIRPRRGSSISWRALYAEATTAAYQTEISDMDAMSCRSERNESDDTIRPETPRKKHRLSKYQSTILEESFREQSTLIPKHKSALASKLNLEPRQVDVWFQNRRARTKWKRNEVECDNLKRCCENLREENRRLEKELQSLRAMKVPQSPNSMPLAAATLAMCPSCEGIAIKNGGAATSSTWRRKSIPLYNSAFLGLPGQNED